MKKYNSCLKQLIHAYAILPERVIKKADLMTVIMWIHWGCVFLVFSSISVQTFLVMSCRNGLYSVYGCARWSEVLMVLLCLCKELLWWWGLIKRFYMVAGSNRRIHLSLFSSPCSFLLTLPSYLLSSKTSKVETKGLQPRIAPCMHTCTVVATAGFPDWQITVSQNVYQPKCFEQTYYIFIYVFL